MQRLAGSKSLATGLGLALVLCGVPARAEESPLRAQPRTSDELVQLHATAAGYGALTGAWIYELAGGESWVTWVAPGVSVAAFGVGAVALLDHVGALSLGQPQAIVTDSWLGASIGAAWVFRYRATRPADDEFSAVANTSLLLGGATLGGVIGAVRYALSPSTPGETAFTGSVALWSGALSGLVTGALTSSPERRDDNASLATATGLEVGVVLGGVLRRAVGLSPSIGWVRALDVGAILGGSVAGGIYLLATGSELQDRGTLAASAVGVALGIPAAILLAPRLNFAPNVSVAVTPDGLGQGMRFSMSGQF